MRVQTSNHAEPPTNNDNNLPLLPSKPPMQQYQRVLLLGCGGVGKCLLATIRRMLPSIQISSLVIIDKIDYSDHPVVVRAVSDGARFLNTELTRDNLGVVLASVFEYPRRDGVLADDDQDDESVVNILIDLTVGIGCADVVGWCAGRGVCYVNTALELWDDDLEINGDWLKTFQMNGDKSRILDRVLYGRQVALRDMIGDKENYSRNFTAVIDHGMNPG
ncbi:UNVERIFIED_CONTAM: hypothetical protein HDU68_004377, partial [Siphonaria sp. JEL0065]